MKIIRKEKDFSDLLKVGVILISTSNPNSYFFTLIIRRKLMKTASVRLDVCASFRSVDQM